MDVPEFLTHYTRAVPFRSLSELPEGRIHQYAYARSGILRGLPIIRSLGVRWTIR